MVDRRSWMAVLMTGVMLAGLLMSIAGCQQMAAAWANITGGDTVDPEFELTKGPLLVLIEDPNGVVTEPGALRELHATISENFLEFDVNRRVIPLEDVERLRRTEKDFDRLSIRQIGEKLGAGQVLHAQAERFTLEAEAGAPLFKGEFVTRVKVLSTEPVRDVRLWPRDPSGKRLSVETSPVAAGGDQTAGDVAKELAIKMGQRMAKLFYEHRELDD